MLTKWGVMKILNSETKNPAFFNQLTTFVEKQIEKSFMSSLQWNFWKSWLALIKQWLHEDYYYNAVLQVNWMTQFNGYRVSYL